MNSRALRRIGLVAGVATTAAIVLAGCSGGGDTGSTGSADGEKVTLTVTTFGTMGLDDLYKKYEEEHPNITITATNIDTGGNALTDWKTKQASGGLPDVQAVEEGWLGSVMEVSDTFTDLRDYGAGDISSDWVGWKVKQATDADGRIIGYGTDIGPEALCYNGKLFEAAGLPSDRESVAALFGGKDASWDKFFEVGKQYHDATGKAFYDQSGFLWNAFVNQQDEGYYKADGSLNVDGNKTLENFWMQLADGVDAGLSANQTQWDWGKGKAFVDGTFATAVCPGWMLAIVKGQVEAGGGDATTGWDVADVFPGGPANWGGTFLTVPTTSKHPKEAAELAQWLTAAEQQEDVFANFGNFPSNLDAQKAAAETTGTEISTFFNDAPVGQILSSRADGVVAQYKGPDDALIQEQVFGPPRTSLDAGKADGPTTWKQAIDLLNQLVG